MAGSEAGWRAMRHLISGLSRARPSPRPQAANAPVADPGAGSRRPANSPFFGHLPLRRPALALGSRPARRDARPYARADGRPGPSIEDLAERRRDVERRLPLALDRRPQHAVDALQPAREALPGVDERLAGQALGVDGEVVEPQPLEQLPRLEFVGHGQYRRPGAERQDRGVHARGDDRVEFGEAVDQLGRRAERAIDVDPAPDIR